MKVLPFQQIAMSQSESEVMTAVGDGAVIREIMTRLNLKSIQAIQARVKRLVEKGALKFIVSQA